MNESAYGFLKKFRERGGIYVLTSSIFLKIISLITSILVVRLLDKNEYANITYAILVVSLLVPLLSSGFSKSVLRFGGLQKDYEDKYSLYNQIWGIGITAVLVLTCIIYFFIPLIVVNNPGSEVHLKIMLLILPVEFFYMMYQSKIRIFKENRTYSFLVSTRALILFFSVVIFVFPLGSTLYTLSLVLSPLIALLIFKAIRSDKGFKKKKIEISYYKFLIFSSLSGFISKVQLLVGGLFVANIVSDSETLALYRVAMILPLSILLVPQSFFKSEYIHLTENYKLKDYVVKYLINYYKLSVPFSMVIVLITYLFSDDIIVLFFGVDYVASSPIFLYFIYGVLGSFLLRQPFGNLNNVAGRVDLNLINSLVSLFIMLYLLDIYVPLYGITGAAIVTSVMLWFSGMISLFFYYFFTFGK